uniref:Uncharacterized protein n=1 Tax=Panagrolaimus davidi TaxID=227884 RepID=A0A914PE15_9BILA
MKHKLCDCTRYANINDITAQKDNISKRCMAVLFILQFAIFVRKVKAESIDPLEFLLPCNGTNISSASELRKLKDDHYFLKVSFF